jgi:tetratricopeptide (TPR) repeat protein
MSDNNMRCPICDNNDHWQNVDQYRIKPSGMSLCMKCGFCSYPEIINKTDQLKEFYREEYRDVPSVNNLFSGQRKLHYHNEFLSDLFKEWIKKGFNPVVCEVGAAFGMFLHWVKTQLPGAQINGTELTLSFRRNAWHEYGINLTEEMDLNKKYDLIASYKVAEHIPHIDVELRKYAEALSNNGLLYISVPCWFKTMNNFGLSGFSLEYYYHKNHINVWTRKLFETLLKKCGLEVIKENHVYYDSTYLCKRNDSLMFEAHQYEDPFDILDRLDRIKKASMAHDSSKFDEAVKIWPDFPEAQIARYESKRQQYHQQGFEGIHEGYLKTILETSPESAQIVLFVADICMRYSKWELAMQYLDQGIRMRPNDPGALVSLGNCFRHLSEAATDPKDKIRFIKEARDVTRFLKQISFQNSHEAVTWIFNDNARIPMGTETSL